MRRRRRNKKRRKRLVGLRISGLARFEGPHFGLTPFGEETNMVQLKRTPTMPNSTLPSPWRGKY